MASIRLATYEPVRHYNPTNDPWLDPAICTHHRGHEPPPLPRRGVAADSTEHHSCRRRHRRPRWGRTGRRCFYIMAGTFAINNRSPSEEQTELRTLAALVRANLREPPSRSRGDIYAHAPPGNYEVRAALYRDMVVGSQRSPISDRLCYKPSSERRIRRRSSASPARLPLALAGNRIPSPLCTTSWCSSRRSTILGTMAMAHVDIRTSTTSRVALTVNVVYTKNADGTYHRFSGKCLLRPDLPTIGASLAAITNQHAGGLLSQCQAGLAGRCAPTRSSHRC